MSFLLNWLDLSVLDLKSSINAILEATSIPQLPKKVSISSLSLGQKAPKFEILDIIDFKEDRFKGLFKFNYNGELNVVFNTDYEANAIKLIEFDSFTKPNFVLADKSTILPVEFKIENVKIDAILTVVYNGRITVVFSDDPFIDLDISTSLDEFLDEELFEMIKQDTLNMVTEMIKQDLPEMLHSMTLEESKENDGDSKIKSFLEQEVEPTLKRSISTLSLFEQPTNFKLQENLFDTLSLKPHGFTDVIQRVSLSKIEYQNMDALQPHRIEGKKKRRVVKMNTKSHKKKQNPKTAKESTTPSVSLPEVEITPEQDVSYSKRSQSESSATTLIDASFSSLSTNSLDEYLNQETLVPSDHVDEDPYETLIHPMDLLPSYKTDLNNVKIIANALRPRGPSSNYINLNNDFKELLKERKDSVDEDIFYDFE